MKRVRELSKARVKSLSELSGRKVDLNDLVHMKSGNGYLDLDKANSWIEVAAAERITKDPRRQSFDENSQLLKLGGIFIGIQKLIPSTAFLFGGEVFRDKSKIKIEDAPDLDAEHVDSGWSILWTLKGGQNCGGGVQNKQFNDVIKCVKNAPSIYSEDKVVLAIYVNGEFWTAKHKKYLGWGKYFGEKFSLLDIIRGETFNKKCVVFTDANLPPQQSSFYDLYIKNQYDL